MDFNTALQSILKHLQQNRGATNNVLIELIEGDSDLFHKVREHLIFKDLAEDKKGVGLVYLNPVENAPEKAADKSTTIDTSQSFKIFISYGRKDAKPLAVKLEKDLASKGHDVWLDTSQMQSGSSWESQIEKAILSHDIFISLLTPHAVRRPDGVCLDEISLARFHNRKIVPAMVIQCRPPLSIYRLDWVDFTGWDEHHNYMKSFERVNRALHTQEAVEGLYAEIFSNLKPLDFGVDIARLTIDFTGRQWLFDEVDQWLLKSSSKVFFITGDPGIGKSAIMAHLAARHPQVMAFHFCISSLADSLNPDSFVRSLAAQLSTQIEDYHDAIKLLNFEQLSRLEPGTLFRRIIADPLKSIQLKEEVVILIDALDEVWEEKNHNIVRILHERLEDLPDMVKVIVSSRDNPGIFDLLSKYEPYEIDPKRAENKIDIDTYLDKKLNSPAIKKTLPRKDSILQDIKQSVISKSEGNFLYIKQFIYGIETGQIDINDITSYPKGLVGIYTAFFDRLFKGDEDYSNYRSILEVITCLKVPFSAGELAPILQLSEFEIGRKMETLSAFFSVQNGKYLPYHKSITDWLRGVVGSGNKYLLNMENGRQKLCEFLLKQYEEEDYNPYLLDYLPYHLIESRRYQELTDLLLDFRFIIQKCRQGQVYELIKDYHAAFAVIPETSMIKNEEKEYIEQMANYTRHLVSDPDRVLEEEIFIKSFTPWSERQIEAEIERIKTSPTIKDKLKIFLQFLDSQAHLLYRHGSLDGYLLQQAYNYAGTGPFAAAVDSYLKKCSHHKLLFTRELREEFNPFDPCLRVFHEHTERVLGVSLTYDGKYAVTGSNDNLLKLWDMQSGECLKTICPHADYLKSLDATPDLNLVVSSGGSQDPAISIWNYKDLEPRGKLEGHTDRVNHLKITPNGRYVISCSNDHTVKIWDTSNLQCIADFKNHTAEVVSIDISIDGKIAASGGYDNTIYIWDVPRKKVIRSIQSNSDYGILGYALKLSHDNKILYSSAGYEDTSIKVWDLKTGNCIKTLRGNEYARNCLEVTHDGRFLVSAKMDKTINIWNLETDTCIKTIRGHIGPIRSLKITPDLKFIISGGGGKYDSTARVWNINKSKLTNDTTVSRNIREIQFDPSGDFIVNLSRKVIQIRDPRTSKIITELKGHRAHIKQVWINPEGNQIISAGLDKTIRLWDLKTNECYGLLTGHSDGIMDFELSMDHQKLLSCGWDGQIIEWDLDRKKQINKYRSKETCIIYVAYVHDDRHILSIGYEDSLKIWDVLTGDCLHIIQSPLHITCRTTPDSLDNLYLGHSDGSIQYWNTHENELRPISRGHNELVSCLELIEPEQSLFSGSSDCTIRQWDITTGHCLGIFEGHTDEIISIRKIPGQDKIITASWDHSIRVWEIHSRECVAVLSTNLLVTSLTKVEENGRFAYGTIQGEFKIIDLNQTHNQPQ